MTVAWGKASAEETMYPKSLADLNRFLAGFTEWQAVRCHSGYYYFIHPTKAPSNGVYVNNCRHLTLAAWRREIKEIEDGN
jgi:hypothetical protein